MAKRLDKNDIVSLNIIRPYHVSQSVDAFTGTVAYDINVSGSFQVTGSTTLSGSTFLRTLTNTAQSDVLTYNQSTGRVYFTASSAIGGTDTNIGNSNLSVPSATSRILTIPNGSTVGFSGSFAQGTSNNATGVSAHAEGYHSTASGDWSHAEGNQTVSSGPSSHAEGLYVSSSGLASHAEGLRSKAINSYSHAEGVDTEARGIGSHVEGRYSTA